MSRPGVKVLNPQDAQQAGPGWKKHVKPAGSALLSYGKWPNLWLIYVDLPIRIVIFQIFHG